MGAFFFTTKKEQQQVNLEKVRQTYFSMGLKSFIKRDFGQYCLLFFQKIVNGQDNFIEDNGFFLGTIGTPVYKGLNYRTGLKQLLNDFIANSFSFDDLIGHYYIFIWDGQRLTILYDGGNLIKAFHDSTGKTLSSSFLALTESMPKLNVNKNAAIENLITGGIGGGETLFMEINELAESTHKLFPEIDIQKPKNPIAKNYKSKTEAIEHQLQILNSYFSKVEPIASAVGVDCGLTGGLDSRLLLALSIKHFKKIQVHSHSRIVKSKEWEIAHYIAASLELPFVSPQIINWQQSSDDEKHRIIEQSCLFYDGQIRLHCNWNEEYNTLAYRLTVLNNKGFGLHGVGGEQYRNVEHRFFSYDFKGWIENCYIGKLSGKPFTSRSEERAIIERLRSKIKNTVEGLSVNGRLGPKEIMRIQNEYVISSFRGCRTHAETKVSFFLSPFADSRISTLSYSAIPFHGYGIDFEREMINSISPKLASFQSDYGFRFNRKEPFTKKLAPFILENIIPKSISLHIVGIYKKIKGGKGNEHLLNNKSVYIRSLIQQVERLELPLDINQLLNKPDVAPLVLSLGYLLKKVEHKLLHNA